MKNTTLRRTGAIGSLAFVLALGLSACGDDDSDTKSAPSNPGSSATTDGMADDAGAQTFGTACSAIPKDGAGSFNGMATAPVASAASANPLLTTLVTAVKEAGLVDTLNSADDLTVFAPTNDAFAKLPKKDLDAVLADKALLTKVLTHHVIAGQLSPEELAGVHDTLGGSMVRVKGGGEEFTVGDENSTVLCGNIPTANATVYVVDTVLMP